MGEGQIETDAMGIEVSQNSADIEPRIAVDPDVGSANEPQGDDTDWAEEAPHPRILRRAGTSPVDWRRFLYGQDRSRRITKWR